MNLGLQPDRGVAMRWLLIGAWLGVTLISLYAPTLIAPTLARQITLALMVAFTFAHGAFRYGWPGISTYFILAVLVTNLFENMSISSGFPFGHYHHMPSMGPKLLAVPLIVGPIFAVAGYLGWVLAGILLGDTQSERARGIRLAQPIIAAFITTSWDLCVDPIGGTLNRDWVWAEGGGYFGVPWMNFFGWLLTTWVMFQLFALYLAMWGRPGNTPRQRVYWMQPIVFWLLIAAQFPLLYVLLPDAAVSDPTGQSWQRADLLETMALAAVFTMVFVGLLCTFLVQQPRR